MQPLVAPVTHWSQDLHQNTGAPQGKNGSYIKRMGIHVGRFRVCVPTSPDLSSAPLWFILPASEGREEQH